jgi:hypothetical protein
MAPVDTPSAVLRRSFSKQFLSCTARRVNVDHASTQQDGAAAHARGSVLAGHPDLRMTRNLGLHLAMTHGNGKSSMIKLEFHGELYLVFLP